MNSEELKQLFKRHIEGSISESELKQLNAILKDQAHKDEIKELLDTAWDGTEDHHIPAERARDIYENIIHTRNTRHFKLWPGIAAAVAIAIGIALAIPFFSPKQPTGYAKKQPQTRQISPGSNKAVLTLADGSQIVLNDSVNGHLASQENVEIRKVGEGQLQYSVKNNTQSTHTQTNTIETPRGGEYKLVLPDGTQVWLNAHSSLTYPVYFSGKERVVKMQGEAYFEVAKNKDMPFKVISEAAEIKVLGTHFNINAYADEPSVKTTLLEGSLDVNNHLLVPGQQAQTIRSSRRTSTATVNTEDVIAWKNGLFIFRNENIQSIMRKISRWYDVEVEFKDKDILSKNFGGTFSRFDNVSELLRMMELTGVIHFKIEERRIIVMQ